MARPVVATSGAKLSGRLPVTVLNTRSAVLLLYKPPPRSVAELLLRVLFRTVSNNSATLRGGGLYNNSTADLVFSTVTGNLPDSFAPDVATTGRAIYILSAKPASGCCSL